ncbi:hypothetical protein [Rathayibacter sp. Leaf296]|uniref:hypothetical protein n=1 Tax=Rathayibacter sp. Leaf296 TaxID=1736327 RepID=UPI000702D7AC|nr:hypothetical protein [Rathayibacter sp. Leaf296]KQQ07394.1 hypothetical protein ASF46_17170 [Rathayibacter sp. Leaf296]
MSSFGFDAPEDVTDTSRPDPDSIPAPPEDPAQIDDPEALDEALDEGADARLGDEQDPPEHPVVPSPS